MKKMVILWQADRYFLKYIHSHKIKQLYKITQYDDFCKYSQTNSTHAIPLGNWINHIGKSNIVLIFFDSLLNDNAISEAKRKNPKSKIVLYYWNKINENNKGYLNNKEIDEFYTFHRLDAEKYHLKYQSQFYTDKIKLKKREKYKYDICFLGREKGRKKTIQDVQREFSKRNMTYQIRIVEKEQDLIPYEEYLKIIQDSKCILDIITETNRGGLH